MLQVVDARPRFLAKVTLPPRLILVPSTKISNAFYSQQPLSMRPEEQPDAPSAPWRAGSTFFMGAVGLLCKGFLTGLSRVETHGFDDFLKLLDEREDVEARQRGLITGTPSLCCFTKQEDIEIKREDGLILVQSQTIFLCTRGAPE